MPPEIRFIAELATVIPGFSPKPSERQQKGKYLLLGGRNINDGRFARTDADSFVNSIDRESFRRAVAQPGDIIVSTLFNKRKLYRYRDSDPPAVVNNSCAIIRAGNQSDYLISYLRTLEGQRDFLDKATQSTSGAFIPRLSPSDLAKIEIPILPFEELGRLGDESLEHASADQLVTLQAELQSKDAEIQRLTEENKEVVRFYEDRLRAVTEQIASNSLATRIKHGETATLEFKSSLRWNLRMQRMDREIENAVVKTIVAFCNSEGGELLIGVADDKTILGVEHDGFDNDDKFQLHLRNLLMDRILPSVADLVNFEMVVIGDKTICHVVCQRSENNEVWFQPDKNSPERFFIRFGPSSTELTPIKALAYIRDHFQKQR